MEALIAGQEDIHNRIIKARANHKKSSKDRITEKYIEVRIETLDELWTKFLLGHKNLIEKHHKEMTSSTYVKTDMYDTTQELYVEFKTELKSVAQTLVYSQKQCIQDPGTSFAVTKNNSVKLPKIVIPTFSGKYTEWTTFRDLFESLIHNNETLDNVQKMHYLKGYLSGEAEQLLRQIPISNSNYNKCWECLNQRYNNKRFICQTILKRFLSQKNATCESANFLKELIDTSSDCLHALENIGIDVSTWDVIVIHLLTLKLDPETRKQWELTASLQSTENVLPTFEQFREFITNRFRALEFIETKKIVNHNNNTTTQKARTFHVTQGSQCPFCSEPHKIIFCKQFVKQDVDSRREFVQTKGLCFNCLGGFHSAKVCQNPTPCRVCKRRHHSLLHPKSGVVAGGSSDKVVESVTNVGTVEEETEEIAELSDAEPTNLMSYVSSADDGEVLLATAVVGAQSKNSDYYPVRAMIDPCSQISLVTEAVVQSLGLKRIPIRSNVFGIGGQKNATPRSAVILNLQSLINPEVKLSVKAYVLSTITAVMPGKKLVDLGSIDITGLQLADPDYHTPNKIDVLLSAVVYSKIISGELRKNKDETLVVQATSLGWIILGAAGSGTDLRNVSVFHTSVVEDDLLKKFWELESDVSMIKSHDLWTEEERRCEKIFATSTTRDDTGRYVVKLPFHDEDPTCKYGQSRDVAENRFYALEKRLNKNPELSSQYKEVMDEYLQLGHMEKVPETERNKSDAVYLPHHAVVKKGRDTTKVRVVFDASCKGKNGVSLNDNLMIGPKLQPDLRHLVLRWRLYPIPLVSDIEKMYRQVKVKEEDANFQRLLWRDSPDSELQDYRLLRVTFGTASAPYLAVKALQQVALDGENYPLAAERVRKEFYMDDLMTGCETAEEGIEIYREMSSLLRKAGFVLQKWTTSSNNLLEMIKQEKVEVGNGIEIKEDEVIKILGLTWNRESDKFQYSVSLTPTKIPVTKRNIISDISRLFDPLGWVAPSVILAKVMIQKLWLTGISWDEEVPSNVIDEWCTYREELNMLTHIHIPRWVGLRKTTKKIELHGFSDASKIAFAAVVYVRVLDETGGVTVTLVSAKTKVAPIKQVSIPRLELCGAVLLTRLLTDISENLNVDKGDIHAWTDSTVVLAWLNSHPNRWKTFVANRVSEILTTLDANQWSHVPSKLNPADYASRGLRPSELTTAFMWFNGPDYLQKEPINYDRPKNIITDLEAVNVLQVTINCTIWDRFSSLTKLVRVVAYCRRFLNLRKPVTERHNTKYLSSNELSEALDACIRQSQKEYFEEEIKIMKNKQTEMPRGSPLKSLNPFFDDKEIMRVGGRLANTVHLSNDRKHPIVLPKNSTLSRLIVANAHIKTLHGAPQIMQNYINSRYWILGSKDLVNACFRKCVTCIRHSTASRSQSQLMGQLPAARATPARPFKLCGVDYAGPIQLRTSGGRGHKSFKGYICLFVCMSTRAVHIEVVSSLTTEGFLQAFKRMVARRGPCQEIWSDNGTNFQGASRELKLLLQAENQNMSSEIAESLATEGTTWHFIPPHAPNFGGLWEAGIKSAKYHLKRVIGESTLTYEEITTVLTQVEACLNSRPLTRIDSDPDNINVLTPGHFLVGEPLITVPDYNYSNTTVSNLRRWQFTQRMVQDFWRKWSNEYLTRFLHRYKWSQQTPEPNIGDVVLIKEDDMPPSRWLLGKIVKKHPGADNITRVVTIRSKGSFIKRPTSKICVLPVND